MAKKSSFIVKRTYEGYEVFKKRLLRKPELVLTAENEYQVNLYIRFGKEGLNALKSIEDKIRTETAERTKKQVLEGINQKLDEAERDSNWNLNFIRELIA